MNHRLVHDQIIAAIEAMHAQRARGAARCAGCGATLPPDGDVAEVLSMMLRNGAGPFVPFCACRACLLDAERRSRMLYAVETRSRPPNRPAMPTTQGEQGGCSHNPSKRLQGPEIQ